MKILTIAGMILAGAATAGIYDAGLYSQVPLTDVSDANRAMYIAYRKDAFIGRDVRRETLKAFNEKFLILHA